MDAPVMNGPAAAVCPAGTGEAAPPHALPIDDVLRALDSAKQGLGDGQVRARRERYGSNELAEASPVPVWRRFARQFSELVIWILIAAAVISALVGERLDAVVILAIVVLNGVLGFLQEEKASRALAALRKLSTPLAKVIRGGTLQVVAARELVPGDRIELEAGDNVPADARLTAAASFKCLEAALTGESLPVDKDPHLVLDADTLLGDRQNMVYTGTVSVTGKASAVVTAIGMRTELGQIAGMLQETAPELTPLQRRLAELGKLLLFIIFGIIAVIFTLHLLRGGELVEVFLLSVSLAVAAVPEGMPAVVTIALALGLHRMVRRNALVRKLPSVETLGSVTVICSDKTGTLTRNEMSVRAIVAGDRHYRFTGAGYAPSGDFLVGDRPVAAGEEAELHQLLTVAAICNHARVRQDESGFWRVVGDPTEGALVVAALAGKVGGANEDPALLFEIPFDSDRKMMSVVARDASSQLTMYTKGAPEVVLHHCTRELRDGQVVPLDPRRREQVVQANHALAARALRVLGFAYAPEPEPDGAGYVERDLIFAGLCGMIDPPREEAKRAVDECHAAGIRPVMITGDHPDTALAIARELGITGDGGEVVSGQRLDQMSDADLRDAAERTSVYARVSAAHKLRIVKAWQGRGQVVAMTGDGVNDAPAVKAADIGIAMGVTGTDVTKEASDMVLADDNFASIVAAVEEGRGIFDNIQKFIQYLLASNFSEIAFVFAAALVGWPVPLTTIQILWINLVTDSLPALALGVEPPEPDIMRRPPRPPREPVITLHRGLLIVVHGLLLAGAAAAAFALALHGNPNDIARARTVAFCTLAAAQLFYAFGCRSQRYTMPQIGAFTNPKLVLAIAVSGLLQLSTVTVPVLRPLFETTSDMTWEWGLIVGLALAPVTIIELAKIVRWRVDRSSRTVAIMKWAGQ